MLRAALTIGGSDPSGGAGIQADLKTFHRFGVYGEAAITLVTVQNTERVSHVELMPPVLVAQQVEAVIGDIPPRAAKTGALGSADIVEAVASLARSFRFPLVVDPVMISKHGARLLDDRAAEALKTVLLPFAALVTPNVPEAEALAGIEIASEEQMKAAAVRILEGGCEAVLVKGGHLAGDPVDILHTRDGVEIFRYPRIASRHTHGTGCTYSAAITAGLALGRPLAEAVRSAREYLQEAIRTAPGLGRGSGPVNHFA